MPETMPTNKLSIYLIKDEYSNPDEILKNREKLQSENVAINDKTIGVLYFGDSHAYEPTWVAKFFSDSFSNFNDNDRLKLFNASTKAVLLVNLDVDGKEKIFAISFGMGWTLLNSITYEERFGLKTTLNVVNPEKLRRIDKKNMTSAPKNTTEQLSMAGVASDFGIDIEQDLVRAVTGASKIPNFGKTVSGKDSLSVSTKVDLSNIQEFLLECYKSYTSENYKENFSWVDQIAEIKNKKTVKDLNNKLLEKINSGNFDNFWMAVPEIVDWHSIEGFSYTGKRENLHDDIKLSSFLENLQPEEQSDVSLEMLKDKKIVAFSSENEQIKYQWNSYNCLYCEIEDSDRKKTYLLSNANWYEIENDFVAEVNQVYEDILCKDALLPDCSNENENDYNTRVANQDSSFCCMDRQIIQYGGSRSKIEFCDLIKSNNTIIHVKHYGGSSVLSHLFSQGVVSGELFLADNKFRERVNEKLSSSHKLLDTNKRPDPDNYEIVFAIISEQKDTLSLPFFSKVSLRNAKRRLETFGYKKVSLIKVSNNKQEKTGP